jgi:recombination protein RecT
MTEPNRRRQQPPRTDVAPTGPPAADIVLSQQERNLEQTTARVRQVAAMTKSFAPEMARLLPDHIKVETFMSAAGAALYRSGDLMSGALMRPDTFVNALREAAMLGHVPGTDHYWLTPRKASQGQGESKRTTMSVLGIEGYQGIVERMYRSGGVLSVHAGVVYANDEFDPDGGPGGRTVIRYPYKRGAFASVEERSGEPIRYDDKGNRFLPDPIGAYAFAMLPGGVSSQAILISFEELMDLKARHAAAGGRIWDQHPIPMMKKTALRRLEPYVPVSAGYRQTAVQAQAFVAQAALQMPVRMEDAAPPADNVIDDTATVTEGVVEENPEFGGQDRDKPVAGVPYDPEAWGGDPAWNELSVTRPGEGVPPSVRGDA